MFNKLNFIRFSKDFFEQALVNTAEGISAPKIINWDFGDFPTCNKRMSSGMRNCSSFCLLFDRNNRCILRIDFFKNREILFFIFIQKACDNLSRFLFFIKNILRDFISLKINRSWNGYMLCKYFC